MIRRGIVVVHGVGDQRRADQLDTVVEALVGFLSRVAGHGNVRLIARSHREGGATPSATIRIGQPDAEPLEEWHVREAWWAQSFKPSNAATVLGWALRAFGSHVMSTLQNVFLRNVARLFMPSRRGPPPDRGVWTIARAGLWIFYLLDAIAWFLITIGYGLVYVLGFLLLFPVYLFLVLPLEVIWPPGAAALRRALLNTITGGIGDQHAMTNRYVAISAAANVVSTALQPFLDPDDLEEKQRRYETVTVIAHSGGAVVAYDALAGEEVKGWLARGEPGRRVTWITAGSGLNLAWRMRATRKDRDRAFWHRALGRYVNWIDIYARYDPVPQGEPPSELVAAVVTGDEAARQDPDKPVWPFVCLRVANDDWPFSDHGGYWTNRAEAMARIVHAISDSRLGRSQLDPADGSYAVREANGVTRPHLLAAGVQRAVEDGSDHRRSVTVVQSIRLAIGLAVAAALLVLSGRVAALGKWLLGERAELNGWTWLPDGFSRWLNDYVPHGVLWLDIDPIRAWLVGAAALLLLLLVVLLILRPIRQLVRWLRPEPDEPPPPELQPSSPSAQAAPVGTPAGAAPPGSAGVSPATGG